MKFYILDDDISTRTILQRIIKEELLGEVIGHSDHPIQAQIELLKSQPNIVLIDLLMPIQDGIETVKNINRKIPHIKFIMISQIENKEMVANAYKEGIEYFIHKPINRIEVTSIIQKVVEKVKMEQSLQKIKEGLSILPFQEVAADVEIQFTPNIEVIAHEILSDLGILGETGSTDLIEIMRHAYKNSDQFEKNYESLALKKFYIEVLENKGVQVEEKGLRAYEQRLRRAINQSLTNLASLGLTDYAHPTFEYYAPKFFDFNEIRLKMNELEKRKSLRSPRINIRKFLYAFYLEVKGRA